MLRACGNKVIHRYMPYDLPGSMSRFFDLISPVLVLIMETEIWPNLLYQCRARGIPVALVNARLSAKSVQGYRRVQALIAPALETFSVIAAQTVADATRIGSLGVSNHRIHITGNLKFDFTLPPSTQEVGGVLRRQWGEGRNVWIASSTHEGEEDIVLDAFARIQYQYPDALLVLVPRHPERFARVGALCRQRKFSVAMRSSQAKTFCHINVFIGDSMGELPFFYAASDIAFVGGSLVPIGGHNMIEPAALGLPILLGPYLCNFAEIGKRLVHQKAAFSVNSAESLAGEVLRFFRDPNLRYSAGGEGKKLVAADRGAGERVVKLVMPLLNRIADIQEL